MLLLDSGLAGLVDGGDGNKTTWSHNPSTVARRSSCPFYQFISIEKLQFFRYRWQQVAKQQNPTS
jgi:hypothetical protein